MTQACHKRRINGDHLWQPPRKPLRKSVSEVVTAEVLVAVGELDALVDLINGLLDQVNRLITMAAFVWVCLLQLRQTLLQIVSRVDHMSLNRIRSASTQNTESPCGNNAGGDQLKPRDIHLEASLSIGAMRMLARHTASGALPLVTIVPAAAVDTTDEDVAADPTDQVLAADPTDQILAASVDPTDEDRAQANPTDGRPAADPMDQVLAADPTDEHPARAAEAETVVLPRFLR
jgi:hypothetical protein